MSGKNVFLTGGTGYMGRRLIHELVARHHQVRALVRPGSLKRLADGAQAVVGNALDSASYLSSLHAGDTLVHLVGTPHPSPLKGQEFQSVDLVSALAAVAAAKQLGVAHFIYLSVAQPAPLMTAYLEVRAAGERAIREAGLTATILRPWYVLGPGHWWPVVLYPFYKLAELVPGLKEGAERLGLVTLQQMIQALAWAVENPPEPGDIRFIGVAEIRQSIR